MNIAAIKKNEVANTPGISVSLYVSGCDFHCPECHNPEAWDFDYGSPITQDFYNELIAALTANGVKRSLAILGGEPLHPKNREEVYKIVTYVKDYDASIPIWIWTGYTFEDLLLESEKDHTLDLLLDEIDILVDGPYVKEQRDITLKARGSKNQRIIYMWA